MARTHRTITGTVLAVVALSSCGVGDVLNDRVNGSGDVRSETRQVGAFDRIALAGEGRVLVGAGADGAVEIETDDNLLDHIEVDVSGGTLRIRTESRVDIDPTDSVTYRLGCPTIEGVELTGAGDIELDGTCTTTDRLELELRGAGRIEARDLELAELRVRLPGAGDIEVDGRADRLDVVLSGAASLDAADLRVAEADVRSSGVGVATLWVTDALDAELSGVGTISYFGDPAVSESVDGLGDVEALGPKGE